MLTGVDADAEPHPVPPQQGDTARGAYAKAPSAATYKVQQGLAASIFRKNLEASA